MVTLPAFGCRARCRTRATAAPRPGAGQPRRRSPGSCGRHHPANDHLLCATTSSLLTRFAGLLRLGIMPFKLHLQPAPLGRLPLRARNR